MTQDHLIFGRGFLERRKRKGTFTKSQTDDKPHSNGSILRTPESYCMDFIDTENIACCKYLQYVKGSDTPDGNKCKLSLLKEMELL